MAPPPVFPATSPRQRHQGQKQEVVGANHPIGFGRQRQQAGSAPQEDQPLCPARKRQNRSSDQSMAPYQQQVATAHKGATTSGTQTSGIARSSRIASSNAPNAVNDTCGSRFRPQPKAWPAVAANSSANLLSDQEECSSRNAPSH